MTVAKNGRIVSDNKPYILAVVLLVISGVTASVIVTIFRQGQDNGLIIAAIFGFLTPTTLSLLAFMKSQETHLSVNSRLDGFIKNAEAAAGAKGELKGQSDARIEAKQ